ncbi:MAG: ATP-binding protein [Tannerella sp.]|jgi:hypothetical protein|nr:ATP-binding protein [Tannerella sp.]
MLTTRRLPVGVQDFEDLRTTNYLYVDKTEYIYRLINRGKPYFLGRPRRFGKSLLLSTLKAYFLGKKELFEGLAIAEPEKDWIEYPVFHIDMNVGIITDDASLKGRLDVVLTDFENKWGRTVNNDDPATRFEKVIQQAYSQTGKKVVVLIDEYDKPLLNTMDDITINDKIRDSLNGFYGVLKSADASLRFVFLTGVTKFSKVSVFSDLNHLDDISMDERFAGICGISETELARYFEPELQALAEKRGITRDEAFAEMKKLYDGYHFAKECEDMYNPFSVLNTFAKRDFAYYWFQTGTPTFLIKMLKEGNVDITDLENNIYISAASITDYRTEWNNPVPVLYQSGYLTIKRYDSAFDEYVLGYPNEEVKYGFINELLPIYAPQWVNSQNFSASRFVKCLLKDDVEEFMTSIRAFFASIPYDLSDRTERYYQLVFYLIFTLMGQFIRTEVKGARGRADAVVETADTIYVFEFKMEENASAEKALEQIDNKGYLIPYTADGRKLVKVGAEFSAEERILSRWIVKS